MWFICPASYKPVPANRSKELLYIIVPEGKKGMPFLRRRMLAM